MTHLVVHQSRRRQVAGLVTAGLVLSGSVALTTLATDSADAAVLGTVALSPTSGTDSTIFGGSVANAACPAGTGDAYWSVDGPDLPADQAILGPATNTTGTGPQDFSGASIANVRSANAGSFSASGVYNVRFNCVATATGAVTDTYTRKISYTAGGAGAWAYLTPSASTTTLAVSPAQAYAGQTVTLTATVSPGAAAGSVQFRDGADDLGAPVTVNAGQAQLTTAALAEGAHSLTAVFTSADTDAYGSSVSAAKSYSVYGAPTWRPVLYPAPRVGAASLCLASFANAPATTTYAWFLNGVAISGATASSYTVPETSYTKRLSCRVTATNPAGSVNATSADAVAAVGRALVPTTRPYIYGTAKVGYTLTAKVGAWSPAATSYTYQWYVGTSRISGATGATYRVPAAYRYKVITVQVTARRTGWTNGTYRTAGVKIA